MSYMSTGQERSDCCRLVWPARGQAEEKKYFRSVKIFLLSRSGCCLVWPEHWGQSEEQPSVGCCPRPYRQAWCCLVYGVLVYGGWWHHPSITAAAIRSLGRVWYHQLSHTAATRGLHRKPLSPAIITNTARLDTDLSLCRTARPCYAVS